MDVVHTPILRFKGCSTCKEIKPADQFFKDSGRSSGLTPACKECFKRRNKAKKSEISTYQSDYYAANKKRIIERKRLHLIQKKKNDPVFRLKYELRQRLRKAIQNDVKQGSSVADLGCSIAFLKNYIEKKFQPGMSWDNWTNEGWHLDHIRPLVSFDLTDRAQFLQAVHYTNLQPLWATDNLRKNGR